MKNLGGAGANCPNQNFGGDAMTAQSKTVRRDWLKRQVAQGKMEAKTVLDIEHDQDGRNDTFGGSWKPARIRYPRFREHYPDPQKRPDWHYRVCDDPDFIEGQMNFHESDFKSASGSCYKSDTVNGAIYTLRVHSNAVYEFRERRLTPHQ